MASTAQIIDALARGLQGGMDNYFKWNEYISGRRDQARNDAIAGGLAENLATMVEGGQGAYIPPRYGEQLPPSQQQPIASGAVVQTPQGLVPAQQAQPVQASGAIATGLGPQQPIVSMPLSPTGVTTSTGAGGQSVQQVELRDSQGRPIQLTPQEAQVIHAGDQANAAAASGRPVTTEAFTASKAGADLKNQIVGQVESGQRPHTLPHNPNEPVQARTMPHNPNEQAQYSNLGRQRFGTGGQSGNVEGEESGLVSAEERRETVQQQQSPSGLADARSQRTIKSMTPQDYMIQKDQFARQVAGQLIRLQRVDPKSAAFIAERAEDAMDIQDAAYLAPVKGAVASLAETAFADINDPDLTMTRTKARQMIELEPALGQLIDPEADHDTLLSQIELAEAMSNADKHLHDKRVDDAYAERSHNRAIELEAVRQQGREDLQNLRNQGRAMGGSGSGSGGKTSAFREKFEMFKAANPNLTDAQVLDRITESVSNNYGMLPDGTMNDASKKAWYEKTDLPEINRIKEKLQSENANLVAFDRVLEGLRRGNFTPGTWGTFRGELKRIGALIPGLGEEWAKDASDYELLDAISKALGIEQLTAIGGNDTEREMAVAIQTGPGPNYQPATVRRIIEDRLLVQDILNSKLEALADWTHNHGATNAENGEGWSWRRHWGRVQMEEFWNRKAINALEKRIAENERLEAAGQEAPDIIPMIQKAIEGIEGKRTDAGDRVRADILRERYPEYF